ncbi:Bug family tripartite tricarboxylate transporter substrate binding protein [Roseivivax sediminis]|uniref:Tripartite-type tricarboxylate transporter, receptor component TctC n=1 Tax=Roseivivax sediminis TaxID=936889 RepID=A0A1I2AFA7_9RHOB|nr:tripartite tricarboxylate transporter substrate binding protein [Roseivivax sediminis]SFE42651.1 Tripartite-type tricarboxylate transporter, receptor component TctC [Roseivivax sediminis]
MKFLKTLTMSAAALAITAPAALAEWQPRKPVEFIIMAGTGGGADQIARLLQGLIQSKGMSPRPFIPINKPGGSGAEALSYMAGKEGDNHTLLVALNSFYTTPIIQEDLAIDITELAPIGRMAMDTFLLWVNSERDDITDLDSYVEKVKEADSAWRVGGTGSGQEDSILTAMMEKEMDYEVTYIPFPGGGTVAKNLVGNQVDSTVNNPAEQMEFWRAGNTKPIVQFNEEREPPYEDVPTAQELGVDIVYYMQRSIAGTKGMDPEAIEWYQNLFHELFQSEEWQNYCETDGLTCDEWLTGDDLAAFHESQMQRHRELIEEVGAESITNK